MAGQGNSMPGVRRSRSALNPGADAEIAIAGRTLRVAILDVSLSGLRVLRPDGLDPAPGVVARLRFPLDSDRPIDLAGTVVRSSSDQVAFQFDAGGQEDALRALIRRRGQLRDAEHL